MVRDHRAQFEAAKAEFHKLNAAYEAQLKEQQLEKWRMENYERIKDVIELERADKKAEIESKLKEARDAYADKALRMGIDIDIVKEIFQLTDEEALYI